jgi:hypothetical protein
MPDSFSCASLDKTADLANFGRSVAVAGRQGSVAHKTECCIKGGMGVDDRLLSERVQIERKQFYFDLKENPRGRFLKITEDVGGRRDTIIVPSTGLDVFRDVLERVIDEDGRNGATVGLEPPADEE